MVSSRSASGCLHCGLPVRARRSRRASDVPRFCCLGCEMVHGLVAAGPREGGQSAASSLFLRLGTSLFLTVNLMAVSGLAYSREVFGPMAEAVGSEKVLTDLFNYFSLFLATGVLCLLGLPLLLQAGRAVAGKAGSAAGGWISSRWLVIVGVFSAYGLSLLHTVRGTGSLYFDTAAVVLVVVSLGQLLEARARRKASAAALDLLAELPERVKVERPDGVREIDRVDLCTGDRVLLTSGDGVPADGKVERGLARVDTSSLTGESHPVGVEAGDPLLAGSLVVDGSCLLRVTAAGGDTALAAMERTLERARAVRPPFQRLADRVATVFVPLVVLLAAGILFRFGAAGDFGEGLLRALSVLLISCPCALGLAAPLASWHGLRRAASQGILVDSAETLETAAAVSEVAFDKTGTLTRHRLVVARTVSVEALEPEEALALGIRLESISSHPLARVLRASASGVAGPSPEGSEEVPGLGVRGTLEGRRLGLGSGRWVRDLGLSVSPLFVEEGETRGALYLFDEEKVLARFELEEELRDDASEAVQTLARLGLRCRILSGDRSGSTTRIGQILGIPAEGGLLPRGKVERLEAMRARGGSRRRVAMVGDGLNDAPVLAAADLGIALGSASEGSRRSGRVRLTDDRLDRLPRLFVLARDVRRTLRWNLFWAFGFNTIGLALAVSGRLTPVFAALAMVASSLVVVRLSSRAGARAIPRAARSVAVGAPGVEPELPMGDPVRGLASGLESRGEA